MAFSSDSDVNAEYRLYCLNVGNLFTEFARLENTLTSVLKLHLALNIGSPEDTRSMRLSSAIYGSMRSKASRDTIKRLLEAEGSPKPLTDFVENVFSQIGHIETIRDKIAHQLIVPAHPDFDGYWQASDAVNTRNIKKLQVWVFDTTAIQAAAADLNKIGAILGAKQEGKHLYGNLTDHTLPSWQYKPSMLKLVPHKKLIAHLAL